MMPPPFLSVEGDGHHTAAQKQKGDPHYKVAPSPWQRHEEPRQ